MKKIRCQSCGGIWIIKKEDLERQRVCPYCEISVQGKVEFETYDSLDKAIYGAIKNLGEEVLQNTRQMSGFMMDTAPNLKKEIRIFSKTVTDDYSSYVKTLYQQELSEAEITIRKLKQLFIEEEGLSEAWANMICNGLHGAFLYYKGVGGTELINVEVDNFELPKTHEESLETNRNSVSKTKSNPTGNHLAETGSVKAKDNSQSLNSHYIPNEDPEGRLGLALKYLYGTGGYTKDERKAIKLLREQANYHSYIPAYNYLGRIFMKKRDFESALKWYQKSSSANNAEGLCLIGYFYQEGYRNIQQSTPSALGYFAAASATGDFDTMVDIAQKFLKGSELPKEEKVAVSILEAAANSGSADAQFCLAKCFQNGTGVSTDIGKAIALYKTASSQGHREAKLELIAIQGTLSFSEKLKYKIKGYE